MLEAGRILTDWLCTRRTIGFTVVPTHLPHISGVIAQIGTPPGPQVVSHHAATSSRERCSTTRGKEASFWIFGKWRRRSAQGKSIVDPPRCLAAGLPTVALIVCLPFGYQEGPIAPSLVDEPELRKPAKQSPAPRRNLAQGVRKRAFWIFGDRLERLKKHQ